jgi:hypothetical protein
VTFLALRARNHPGFRAALTAVKRLRAGWHCAGSPVAVEPLRNEIVAHQRARVRVHAGLRGHAARTQTHAVLVPFVSSSVATFFLPWRVSSQQLPFFVRCALCRPLLRRMCTHRYPSSLAASPARFHGTGRVYAVGSAKPLQNAVSGGIMVNKLEQAKT